MISTAFTEVTQLPNFGKPTSAASEIAFASNAAVSPKVLEMTKPFTSGPNVGLDYVGGSVLEAAGAAIGQPVVLRHSEFWLITNGKYSLWSNTLQFSVKGPSTEASESAAERLRIMLQRPRCIFMKDAKGMRLPPYAKQTRVGNAVKFEWDAIRITDKSRSPKTLFLPWGEITLIDRVDLPIPSSLGSIRGCSNTYKHPRP